MKNGRIDIRIEKELKEQFKNKCKELNINPSKLIISFIKEFVKEKK